MDKFVHYFYDYIAKLKSYIYISWFNVQRRYKKQLIYFESMKITQLRNNGDITTLSAVDFETLINKVKTEIKSRPVSTFREYLRYALPGDRCDCADKLPKIIPAAEFRKVGGVR